MALLTPLVLSFSSAAVLGAVSSIGGCGMLAGSIVVDTWGGPRRRISGVCAFAALAAVAIVLVGVRPSAALIGAAAYVGFFCSPIINSLANVILPSKVAADVQGRVRRIEDELPGAVIAQAAA
jgi:DHA3 family macrolide efflux protein-like MFS transporter